MKFKNEQVKTRLISMKRPSADIVHFGEYVYDAKLLERRAIELPEVAARISVSPKAVSSISSFALLKNAVQGAFFAYTSAAKGGVRHRHGRTGMQRLTEDEAVFKELNSVEKQLQFIGKVLRRKGGRYHENSFKCVLLNKLASELSIQLLLPSSRKDETTIREIGRKLITRLDESSKADLIAPATISFLRQS